MDRRIDVPWILQVAEAAVANNPAPDDYGVPVSAVARHRAELFQQPVYDGPYAKAAALVHTLGRYRWLEHSNMAVAAASGVMYLKAAGVRVKPAREDAIALKDLLLDPAAPPGNRCSAADLAHRHLTLAGLRRRGPGCDHDAERDDYGIHTGGLLAAVSPSTVHASSAAAPGHLATDRARGIDSRTVIPRALPASATGRCSFDRRTLDGATVRAALLDLVRAPCGCAAAARRPAPFG
jgi:hypothetical protein